MQSYIFVHEWFFNYHFVWMCVYMCARVHMHVFVEDRGQY